MKLDNLLENDEVKYRDALRSIINFALLDSSSVSDILNFICVMKHNEIFEDETLESMFRSIMSKREVINLLNELIIESLDNLSLDLKCESLEG